MFGVRPGAAAVSALLTNGLPLSSWSGPAKRPAIPTLTFCIFQAIRFRAKDLVMSNPKIAVYNLAGNITKLFVLQYTCSKQTDLKNTTDDALPNYLNSLKFKQSHNLTDVRLALGYASVLIAGLTFYFDFKLGWDKTKYWTLWAVVVYFLLNGALTLWIWNV